MVEVIGSMVGSTASEGEDVVKAMTADGRGSVSLAEVTEPEPAADEALIAVEAFSVNRGETYLLESAHEGWRPGKDVAGTVLSAAADGSGPAPGTRVVAHLPGGAWAEKAAIHTASMVELPDQVDTMCAAALPLAGLTALRLLREVGSPLGRRILINGASGGVGHYLTEIAVASGAEVVAVSRNHQRGERLREFGAVTVPHVCEAKGWFDVALESVGGDALATVRRKVHPEGQLIWFGQAGRESSTLDFFDWVRGTAGARITQFHYAADVEQDGVDLRTLVRMVSEGRLHPEIGLRLVWDQTGRAIEALRHREVRGNAVLSLSDQQAPHRGAPPRDCSGTRAVLERYLEALNAGDLDTVAASFSEGAAWSLQGDLPLSGTKRGRAEIMRFVISAGGLFEPGSQSFRFGETTVEGDRAVLEWRVTGVGAATGRAYDNSYCGVFIVRDGHIVEVREYMDTQHAEQALFG